MKLKRIFFIVLVRYCLCGSAGKSILPSELNDNNESSLQDAPQAVSTSFDYDYIPVSERKSFQRRRKQNIKAYTTTTERPLVFRYWNTLLRNVRLPVPSITWNMTNPFANLFNNGESNIIETPVGDYDVQKLNIKNDSDDNNRIGHSNRRKKTHSRRRKNSRRNRDDLKIYKTKKNRRYVYTNYDDYDQENIVVQGPLYYYSAYPQRYKDLRDATQFVPYYYEDYEDPDDYIPPTIPTGSAAGGDVNADRDDEDEDLDENKAKIVNVATNDEEQKALVKPEIDSPTKRGSVRNALGTFMSDDKWNTKRQKANAHQEKVNKDKVTGKQWNPYRFFLLKSS